MEKTQKTATLEEAIEIYKQPVGFVYANPCAGCKKECSTPTEELWRRRIEKFGGVKEMYEGYFCRDCRPKSGKAAATAPAKALPAVEKTMAQCVHDDPSPDEVPVVRPPEPVARRVPAGDKGPIISIRPGRMPGDPVHLPNGTDFAFTIWEGGKIHHCEYYNAAGQPVRP